MIQLNVNDMTCGHCVGAITQAVKALDPAAQVQIDLANKCVRVESAKAAADVVRVIKEAGYSPVPA